jgi:hypothetical protein
MPIEDFGIWNVVGLFTAVGLVVGAFALFVWTFRDEITEKVRELRKPKHAIALAGVVLAIAYGGSKSGTNPQTRAVSRQLASEAEMATADVQWYWTKTATNGIEIAWQTGNGTNDLAAGDFVYRYPHEGAAVAADDPLYVRQVEEESWIQATQVGSSRAPTNGVREVTARLPDGASPGSYVMWFIGAEANLPPVVIVTTGAVTIDRVVLTSKCMTVKFSCVSVLSSGSRTFVLERRSRDDGVYSEWEDVRETTLADGVTSGEMMVEGFTCDRWYEYRVHVDVQGD